jgi:hypothetical protein
MKYLSGLVLFLVVMQPGYTQDSIQHRIILIGKTERLNDDEEKLIQHASNTILKDRTTVLYLDNNKYLQGKLSAGSRDWENDRATLRRLYEPLRGKGAVVHFIAANNEWNNLATGKRKFNTKEETDSLLRIIPSGACPDPVEINLTDNLTVISFNSQWWLYPFDNTATDEDCDCKTKANVLARLDELRYKNQNKFVLLASYHPFQSYGVHGSKGTLKDHLFPLTAVNKGLYIPLPVAGSVYRFFRSSFAGPANNRHPLYKDMKRSVEDIFTGFPNLVYAAGHENGLQLVKDDNAYVVSGPGANHISARKGKYSLYATTKPGYVVADLLHDNSIRFTFYNYAGAIQQAYTYTVPYTRITEQDTLTAKNILGDSIVVQVHPSYDKVGKFRRLFFGENYRKEWAAPTTLPVIRVSQFQGGLTPLQRGGGMQSKSLRLADKTGKEWVIRSVEKSPDALLPENLRSTFARDWLDDATSAQHPFSALIVPPIANAVNVPHATPVIGVIAPDKNLGIHERVFSNMVALVEEREPLGDSDNSEKMKKNLKSDNDNSILAKEFLNARMLDMLVGDWDRHEDQWRWQDRSKGKAKSYLGIPRDRDQVFHLTQGVIPKIASRDYVLPTLRNFDGDIDHVEWVVFKTRFVNAYPAFQLSREEWKEQAEKFKVAVTDSVIEAALRRLPKSSYELRHDKLYKRLQSRRDRIPGAMDEYYRFIQKVTDIQTSDKNEWIQITSAANGGLNVRIAKISKGGTIEDELMNKTYDPSLTKEIRIYLYNGNDSVVVNNQSSRIRLRIIGGRDNKAYHIIDTKNRIHLYDKDNRSAYRGDVSKLKKHISNDSLNTAFVPVNLYNVWMPLTVIGLNLDDGFILGAGFKFTKQEGFRKVPYASTQQLLAAYSFSTGAYRIRYNGDWVHAFGKTDFTLQAFARAPNNTINFFGRGNETVFNKTGDYKRFYRARFSTYQVDPALRWRGKAGSAFSIGPSLYYYDFDKDENQGRFIENTSQIGSYDSSSLEKSKLHLGVALQFVRDKRNSRVLPQWGSFINIRLQAYNGVSQHAKSFAQLIPELAFYKSFTRRSTIVLAERLGGVIGFGNAAFYQSAFIGGHENLFGYRQYRFAGQHSFYNNLELRIKLADIASYIIPGQFGITGFWDIGRVWEKHDNSDKWHNGTGGGIYFAPASVIALSFVAGYSKEGWYPYFTMGLRF